MSHLVRLLVSHSRETCLVLLAPLGKETLSCQGWVSLGDVYSDIDMHVDEMAAGRILIPLPIPLICWISLWIQTQVWCDPVDRGHTPYDPACASHLPSIAPRWLGPSCPNALGPSVGLPRTAAGRLGQQPVSGAWRKPIPALLNESLVSQSLPSGGGRRLEPHSEQCQACCQQPSAQREAEDKEHVLYPFRPCSSSCPVRPGDEWMQASQPWPWVPSPVRAKKWNLTSH